MREVRASSLGLLSNRKQTDSAESRAYGAAVGSFRFSVFSFRFVRFALSAASRKPKPATGNRKPLTAAL
jgi:hypothetical protein